MIKIYYYTKYKGSRCHENPNDLRKKKTSRELLKECIADYLGRGLEDETPVEILLGEFGKPYASESWLEKQGIRSLKFSVSHTKDLWACAIAPMEMGLDIQFVRDCEYKKIARRFFTEEEAGFLEKGSLEDFYKIWVRKEAYVKYIGKGMAEQSLNSFNVLSDERTFRDLKVCFTEFCFGADGASNMEKDVYFSNRPACMACICCGSPEEVTLKEIN